jgi:type IV secretion system protein VirB4
MGDAPADWYPTLTGTAWPGGPDDARVDDIELGLAAE